MIGVLFSYSIVLSFAWECVIENEQFERFSEGEDFEDSEQFRILWKASVLPTLSYINMHLITLFTSLPALI
jgi:hypothetical protein